ncbi:hypothetical protein [Robertkochia flava]|uniref:hypothetical protein n=1 Tax=Robertkochia flava TaxID=3447986 RepID=UPI001CC9758D|nr:hypothetical protein [Robertkochia marina]
MLKWLYIAMAGLITLQSMHMSLNDILSIGNLMEHASYHKDAYGDDLVSFIAKHYGSQQSDHMDSSHKDQHQDLPFQHAFVHAFYPIAFVDGFLFEFYIPVSPHPAIDSFYLPIRKNLFAIKTFQPPRLT